MSEQLSFTRKRLKPSGKLVILSLISLALMVLDSRFTAVKQIKSHLATGLQPVLWLANQPVRFYEYGIRFFHTQTALLEENGRLKTENLRLSAENSRYAAQWQDAQELRKLYRLQSHGIDNGTVAEVISNQNNPLSDRLIINKGSEDGLKNGDAVIDHKGLIGQLTDVRRFNAELTLLSAARNTIPVSVARTGVRSLLYGSGNSVKLRYFPADAALQTGDLLITSGLDSVYPFGIPVAEVKQVQHASGTPYYQVELELSAEPRGSKYVLVLPQQAEKHQVSPLPEQGQSQP